MGHRKHGGQRGWAFPSAAVYFGGRTLDSYRSLPIQHSIAALALVGAAAMADLAAYQRLFGAVWRIAIR